MRAWKRLCKSSLIIVTRTAIQTEVDGILQEHEEAILQAEKVLSQAGGVGFAIILLSSAQLGLAAGAWSELGKS